MFVSWPHLIEICGAKKIAKILYIFYYEVGGCDGWDCDHSYYSSWMKETKFFSFQFLLKTPNFPHLSLFK